ncbi:MAG: LPS export ABC transporter permease LptF [Rhodocyclaceae bacterium]|nr:LPS export ABC transporter permease LptF [Rhodocyclaceae bacterium]
MLFFRAARREFAQTTVAVLIALFAILLVTQLIRLLGQAAGGKIDSEAVLALLGFNVLNLLPVVLTLALFVGVLLTLGRVWRDSEMTIWLASGLSLAAWVRPTLFFAAPFIGVIALSSLLVTPWALEKRAEYLKRMEARSDVARVSPGAFKESSHGDRVFFVESLGGFEEGKATRVANVFVSQTQQGRISIIAAAEGRVESQPNGERFLVLLHGRRYDAMPGEAEHRLVSFARYAFRIEEEKADAPEQSVRAQPTAALLQTPTAAARGELVWRFGLPLAATVLVVMAIPISFVNPRAGRTHNLLLALVIFVAYSNSLSLSQAWVAQERIAFFPGLLGVHLVMAVLMALFFGQRIVVFSWGRWWRR